MARNSELEEFLQAQLAGSRFESAGQFSLSPESALRKLAAFQLPRPTAWILKVVQAVVVSGAPFLNVRMYRGETAFCFDPQEHWSLEEIQQALLDPEVTPSDGLDYLKRGLWSISFGGRHPFHCNPGPGGRALAWDGESFHHVPCAENDLFVLTVSHRSPSQGPGLPIRSSIESARSNAALARELCEGAFVCPIPLELDGRRIDALQNCPSHGLKKGSYPIFLLFGEGSGPVLPVPPATFGKWVAPRLVNSSLSHCLRGLQPPTRQPVSAMLISAHLDLEGTTFHQENSYYYWVCDGVVICRQEILSLGTGGVSCAIFSSANGLRRDLTGFSVALEDVTRKQLDLVGRGLGRKLRTAVVPIDKLAAGGRAGSVWAGRALIALGILMGVGSYFEPLAAPGVVALVGSGVLLPILGESSGALLHKPLREELELFKRRWARGLKLGEAISL